MKNQMATEIISYANNTEVKNLLEHDGKLGNYIKSYRIRGDNDD